MPPRFTFPMVCTAYQVVVLAIFIRQRRFLNGEPGEEFLKKAVDFGDKRFFLRYRLDLHRVGTYQIPEENVREELISYDDNLFEIHTELPYPPSNFEPKRLVRPPDDLNRKIHIPWSSVGRYQNDGFLGEILQNLEVLFRNDAASPRNQCVIEVEDEELETGAQKGFVIHISDRASPFVRRYQRSGSEDPAEREEDDSAKPDPNPSQDEAGAERSRGALVSSEDGASARIGADTAAPLAGMPSPRSVGTLFPLGWRNKNATPRPARRMPHDMTILRRCDIGKYVFL